MPEAERTAPVRRGQSDRRVRVPDGLGGVRRARAEDQHGVVGRPDRRVGRRQGAGAVDGVGRGRRVEVEDPGCADALGQECCAGTVRHGVAGPRETHGGVDLERLPRRAQQDRGRAQLAGARDDRHELRAVGRHHGDPIAWADARVAPDGAPLRCRPARAPRRSSGRRPPTRPGCCGNWRAADSSP